MRLSKKEAVFKMKWPVYSGAAAIKKGAMLMPGVTADTDMGLLIAATTTGLGSVGFLDKAIAAADTDSSVLGTGWNLQDVELLKPYYVTDAEYDQSTTMAVASNSSTTLTITSLENNIDTSWVYATTGTKAGYLSFLVSSAAGSATQKTAMGFSTDTTLIKILRLFHRVAYLNATFDKLGTQAAVGTWTTRILQNKMKVNGDWKYLNPVYHDATQVVPFNTANTASLIPVKFYAEVAVLSSLAAVAS
jgi:hypothetical protein